MAIDFDKAKKNIGKSYDKKMGAWEKEHQKQLKAQQKANKKAKLEEAKKNRGRKQLTPEINAKKDFESIKKLVQGSSYVAPDGSKPKTIQGTAIYQKGSKQEAREKLKASGKKATPTIDNKVFENIANEKGVAGTFGRVYTGVGSGFVDSFTAFPSTVASKVTGKDVSVRDKMGLNMPENNPLVDSAAYQLGELGGELLGYSVQNRAFAPLVNSALKGTKLGKMAEDTFKQRAAQNIARNAIEAGSIGLAQNIGIAQQQGLEGSDFAKDVLINTGLDLVAGSALDIVPDAVKTTRNALKNTKLPKQANNVGEVVDTAIKAADTGDLTPKTTVKTSAPRKTQLKNASQKASFTKDLNTEFEKTYNEDHQKLADYIREYKGKGSTTHIIPINEDATGRGFRSTVSNNDDWYRKALKKYGSNNAVNKNADEIATDILNEELRLKRGQQEYASEYLYDLGELKQRNRLETPTGKVKANGVPINHKKVGGFDVESSNSDTVKPKKANKTLKDLGADVKNPNLEMTYEEASKVYDTYKHGTPKKLPGKGDVSKAADTIIGSDFISDEMRKSLEDNIGNYVKTTKRNKVTVDNVKAKIDKNGLDESIKNFGKILSEGRMVKEEDIAMGAELIKRLDDMGDYERALDVTDDLIEMMSQAGRTLQAANIFSKMTPYGKVRTVKKTAEKMAEKYGRDVVPDEGLLKQLFEEKDPVKSDEIKKELFKNLWEQVPPTLMEKLDAIRYTAMLSSPKTHIRNILGNTAMYIGKGLSDGVGQSLEKAFKGKMDKLGGIRTKSILNPLSAEDKALKSKAKEVFDEIKDTVLNNDVKYIEKGNSRPIDSRIFKSKLLEGSRKVVSGTLEYEDEVFMKLNFESAFAKICKANDLKASDLTAEQIKKFSDYVIQQAQTATFRDPNALATAMNKVYRWANNTQGLSKGSKAARTGVKLAMDATVPFKKTPANVLKQGWRYSPGGVVQGLFQCATAKDAETLLRGIEVLSNGVVGTPMLLAGVYLAKQGLVNGSIGDYTNKDVKYKKMLGQQDYSVTVGDKTITMDWMSPYSMPFFVGVELGTAFSGDDRVSGTEIVDSLASITDPFLEMSMLQGLQTLITADYKTNAAQTLIQNTVQSYVLQFVPAISQQIAKTVAKTATTTSVPSDGTSFGKFLNRTGTQFKGKIPGLYETNEPDIDLWGRTQNKENIWDYVNAGLRNIISPANIKDMNITYVDKEILRLYDTLDYEPKSVIPTPAESNVDFNKENYKMTASEFTKFKKDLGTYRYNELKKLFATDKYKKSSNEEKAKMIQAVYKDANEQAKKKFLISSGKVTEEEYSLAKLKSSNSTGALELVNSGKTTATKVVNAKREMKDAKLTADKDILKAYVLAGDYDQYTIQAACGASEKTIKEAVNLKSSGVGLSEFQKIYANSDNDGNGRIKKAEAIAYLNSTNYSREQKRAIFDALMGKAKNPY